MRTKYVTPYIRVSASLPTSMMMASPKPLRNVGAGKTKGSITDEYNGEFCTKFRSSFYESYEY